MVERYFIDSYGIEDVDPNGKWVEYADHEQALAEKDLQWKRRVGLDCGGHSCFYAIDKAGMRHNGPCSCNPKRTREDHDRLYAAYQQLLEKAVRFASLVEDEAWIVGSDERAAREFLESPEAQAFMKGRDVT